MSDFTEQYLREVVRIAEQLDAAAIESVVAALAGTRARGGRLFILGVGGSAANASHAVNDFRKIAGMEAYAPTDNVSELTARTNDEGWPSVFESWLRTSRLRADDCVLVFSVGGGDLEKNVSPNLVLALQVRALGGSADRGHRGARRRLRRPGGGRVRDRPHRQPGACHAAHGGVPGGGLAPGGVAPGPQAGPDQVGIGAMSQGLARAVFLDRDGVLNRPVVREGKPYPPASADELEVFARRPGGSGGTEAGGIPAVRGDQSARRGARRADSRRGGARYTRRSARPCRSMASTSAITTTATAANAANRSPDCCWRRPRSTGSRSGPAT